MSYLEKLRRLEVQSQCNTLGAELVTEVRDDDGVLLALFICSRLLDDHLWVVFDRRFEPDDESAIYYADEIQALKNKSIPELREIHKTKLTFPKCRVVQ